MLRKAVGLRSSCPTLAAMYHRCLEGGYLAKENEAIAHLELSLL